jgi:lauroyl/myristoyl acyltransferase
MLLKQFLLFLYLVYIRVLALGLALLLWLFRWKTSIILKNLQILSLPRQPFFLLRFYFNLSADFLIFLHGQYPRLIQMAHKDCLALKRMKDHPSLLLTGHFHNWEMMGGYFVKDGVKLLSASLSLKSSWAEDILAWMRRRLASKTVASDFLIGALSHLEQGGCFALLWDQYSPKAKGAVPLLGIAAPMNPLPMFLQGRSRAAAFFAVVLPSGRLRVWQLAKGGADLGGMRLARRYHRFLEKLISHHPTFWYGLSHRRFKNLANYAGPLDVSRETRAGTVAVSRETNH